MIVGRKQPGFTIVELLIVIVVIGILAAMTIAAYNGIQQRASNARTIAVVSTYERALLSYFQLNQSYPAFSPGNGGACLGRGYLDRVGSDGVGDCGETAYPLNEDVAFENSLKTIITSLPVVNNRVIKMPYQTSTWIGASIHHFPPDASRSNQQDRAGFTVDGASNPYYLMYILEGGNADCRNSNIVIPDESAFGWPKMLSSKPAGRNWSWSDNVTSACVIPLSSR